jgi:hypothetical protein
MSGLKGSDDYLYDGTFIDRSEPISKQFIYAEGGITAPTNNGQGNWLAAVNLRTIILPVLPSRVDCTSSRTSRCSARPPQCH